MPTVTRSTGWFAAAVMACAMGCSSSSSPASGDGGTGGGEGGGAPQVTCSQLKGADVQGLMTAAVAGVQVMPVGTNSDGQQCILHDANSEQAIDVIVVPADDPYVGYDATKSTTTNPVAITGVGDEAFRATGDYDPVAKHGNVMCTVSTASEVQIPGVSALVMNGMSPTFTEKQNDIVAIALGTVCNRLFGTGNTTPDLSGL